MNTMTDTMLDAHRVVFAMESLEKWLGTTGLTDSISERVARELADIMGLTEKETEELLEPKE
jgi:hypothetical protein